MIRSMTGFARHDVQAAWGELTWELKSVNHRYLEVSSRLPEALRPIEGAIRQAVGRYVKRGKVEVTARLATGVADRSIAIDEARLNALAGALEQVRAQVIDCRAPDALALLDYPGVRQASDIDGERLQSDALAALEPALTALADSRAEEGARIAEMLITRADSVADHARQVAERVPMVRDELAAKWRARLAELDISADETRLETELVLAAQRMDIAEEVDRLGAHVAAFTDALSQAEPVGRRLDFLMQEFNREANTIGSKSADADVSAAAVEMKVLIEQMREQVQNVE